MKCLCTSVDFVVLIFIPVLIVIMRHSNGCRQRTTSQLGRLVLSTLFVQHSVEDQLINCLIDSLFITCLSTYCSCMLIQLICF